MYRSILRRVGWVIVTAILLDVAWAIYQAIHTHSFSYNFTTFAVGVALLRGSQTAADYIRRLTAFGLAVLICFTVYWIATEPLPLLLARLRFDPVMTIGDWAEYAAMASLCAWSLWQLNRPEVVAGFEDRPWAWLTPRLAFAGGIAFCALFAVTPLFRADDNERARAVRSARAELGRNFHFHLSDLDVKWENGTKHVSATVAAWSDTVVIDLPVTWDE
jgi:hypothetical protein